MIRRVRDQYGNNTYEGHGLWTDTAKKLATVAAEKIISKGSEEVGKNLGNVLGKKLATKIEGKPKKSGKEIIALLHEAEKPQVVKPQVVKPRTFEEEFNLI